jgi:NAD dependent epimerase/dehydratase family enzyme
MASVLLTGGTGVLGRALQPRLPAAGHTVRIMSRRAAQPGARSRIRARVLQPGSLERRQIIDAERHL